MLERNVIAAWCLAKRKLPLLPARDAWYRAACLMGWRAPMAKKFIFLVAVAGLLGVGTLVAQDKGEGTLVLDKKSYQFTKATAFETTIDNEAAIVVVLSSKAIPGEKIKEARDNDKQSEDTDFGKPFLRLAFTKSGEFKHWSARAGNTTIGRHSDKVPAELHESGGRVTEKATLPMTEGMFPTQFDVRFDVALLKAGDSPPPTVVKTPGPAANIKPTVTGMFKGNGKDAKLEYVSARWGEPFDRKAGIVLVFTEKDHSKNKKPDFDAGFGKFGCALIISLHEDGGIYGCQVVHTAHKKQGFSSVGDIETTDFTFADGKVEGGITTHGEHEFFGDTWDINIKFVAPLGEIPKEFQVPESKKEETPASTAPSKKSSSDDEDDNDDDVAAKPKAGGMKVKELA